MQLLGDKMPREAVLDLENIIEALGLIDPATLQAVSLPTFHEIKEITTTRLKAIFEALQYPRKMQSLDLSQFEFSPESKEERVILSLLLVAAIFAYVFPFGHVIDDNKRRQYTNEEHDTLGDLILKIASIDGFKPYYIQDSGNQDPGNQDSGNGIPFFTYLICNRFMVRPSLIKSL